MVNGTIDGGGVFADTGRGVSPLPRERVITNSQGATLEWIVGGGSPNPRLTMGGNWEDIRILYILDFLFDDSLYAAISVLFVYTL